MAEPGFELTSSIWKPQHFPPTGSRLPVPQRPPLTAKRGTLHPGPCRGRRRGGCSTPHPHPRRPQRGSGAPNPHWLTTGYLEGHPRATGIQGCRRLKSAHTCDRWGAGATLCPFSALQLPPPQSRRWAGLLNPDPRRVVQLPSVFATSSDPVNYAYLLLLFLFTLIHCLS